MRLATARLFAIIIGCIALFMLPPLALALALGEASMAKAFIIPIAAGLAVSLPAVISKPKTPLGIRRRDGFLLVFLAWIFSSLMGSLPYYFSPLGMSFPDAIFESSCGFSTTGATVLSGIDALPKSMLLWRSISHWAGGMGIILLAVAIVPLLGAGGFNLIKAEAPGPEKEKLSPRITAAAKMLWGVYCAFTIVLALLYRAGGMEWFDAICHSFTMLSTGGVSTKDAGLGFYNSSFIDWVTVVFMLLGALNYNLYYKAIQGKFRDFAHNTECRVYLFIFIAAALAVSLSLVPQYGSFGEALRFGSFQTASFLTTTGNARADYTAWPFLAQGVLFCLMFIGGCSGSTAGGIKVIRCVVLFKQAGNELRRLLYPQGVFSIQLNRKVGRKDVVYGVAGFVFLYFLVVAIGTLAGASAGFDLFSSFSMALSITGNIGIGMVPANDFSAFPAYLKLFYSLAMIAGRLELWTVLVLFTPGYWRE